MELDTTSDLRQLLNLRERITSLSQELHLPDDGLSPRLDLLDTGDAYRLIAEVPGVRQDDLEVAILGRELTIAGIREPYGDGDNGPLLLMTERPSGHFQRSVTLPGEVVRERGQAHLREGLLVLDLPKA
jgi:HSP20 family protein